MSVEKIGKKYRAKTYFMGRQVHAGMHSTRKEAEDAASRMSETLMSAFSGSNAVVKGQKTRVLKRVMRWLKR